jgi:hypothetical protein
MSTIDGYSATFREILSSELERIISKNEDNDD